MSFQRFRRRTNGGIEVPSESTHPGLRRNCKEHLYTNAGSNSWTTLELMSPNRRGILFRSLNTVAMAKSYFASEDSESCPKRSQSVLSANGSTLGMFTGSIDEKLISTDHSMSDTSGNRSLVSAKFQQRTYKNSLRRPETFMDCLSCHQSQGYG